MNPTQDQGPQPTTQPETPVSPFSSATLTEPTPTPPSPAPINTFGQPPKKNHTVLIVILIVLIVLLAAALAYVLYADNKKTPVVASTTAKTTTPTPASSSTSTTPTLDKITTDQVFGSGLSIKYPSTWTDKHTSTPIPSDANSKTDLSGVNDTNVLTSPDGKVSVTLDEEATGSTPAGTCNNTPGYGSGTLVEYASSPISSFSSGALVNYIDSAGSQLQYGLGVMASTKASGFSQGGSDCKVGLLNWSDPTITSSTLAATKSGFSVSVELTTQLLSLGSAPADSTFSNVPSGTTQPQIQSAFDSSDVTTAKQIMQSLYIKS